MGSKLKEEVKDELIDFLRQNVSTFTWSIEDMKGIDPQITCHELNVDPMYKPIKQKRRKLGPELAKVVNDEVECLLEAGLITEVKYPD